MNAPTASNQSHDRGGFLAYLLLVVLPIAIGSAIYLVIRDSNILIHYLIDSFGVPLPNRFDTGKLGNSIFGSLPDGLWVFAFASWIKLIWRQHWFWCNLPICMAIGSEVGQLIQVVPGTFDVLDIFFYSLGHLLSKRVGN